MRMTQCEIGEIGWIEPEVLLININKNVEIDVPHLNQFHLKALELARFTERYNIINYGEFSFPTIEARDLCESQILGDYILARALVVNDMGQFIIAKHTVKRQKSKVPTRIFTEMENAKNWVRSLKAHRLELQLLAK